MTSKTQLQATTPFYRAAENLMLASSLVGGLVGAFGYLLLAERLLFEPAVVLWVGASAFGLFLALVALLRLWKSPTVTFSQGTLTYRGRFGGWSVHANALTRLALVEFGHKVKVLTFEHDRLSRYHLLLWGRQVTPDLQRILDAVAERSGLPWMGTDKPEDTAGRASFPQFMRALGDATGASTPRQWLRWFFANAFWIRIEGVGVNSTLLNWGYKAFSTGATAFSVMLILLEVLLFRLGSAWAFVVFFLFAVGWILLCLGSNLILFFFSLEVRSRETIEAEIHAARQVQRSLLPEDGAQLPGLEISGSCDPAREVGGDYFDYIHRESGHPCLAVADVAGKGLPAALLMTLVKGALATTLGSRLDLREAAVRVSQQVRRSPKDRRFVTLALVEYDGPNGVLRVIRAGHLPPLLVRTDGTSEWLSPTGMALGLGHGGLFEKTCQIQSVEVTPGDLLVLYSDGVTEAQDVHHEEFGDTRLERIVVAERHQTPEAIRQHILEQLEQFRGEAPIHDDVTLVVARLRG